MVTPSEQSARAGFASPALPRLLVGWREWLALPELGISAIKAKVDTGARSSSLHAQEISCRPRDGEPWVFFKVAPLREHSGFLLHCSAPIFDERRVRSSNGSVETRIFIRSEVVVGEHRWPIHLNLTDRTSMQFPMLLGREAMAGRLTVDPARSYLCGRALPHRYREAGLPPKRRAR